jgi:plastin-1
MASVLKLQRKYPQFPQNEIFQLQDAFRKLDVDDKGYLDQATVVKAAQQSERQPYDAVRQALKEVELDSSGRVELEDYVDLVSKLRESSPAQKRASVGPVQPTARGNGPPTVSHASKPSLGGGGGRIQVQGSSANVTHTINEDERTAFTTHINAVLAGDPDIGNLLPFPTDTFEMFDQCKDGLVLAKLINDSVPDTIDERVLNRPGKKIKTLNAFHMTENNNIVINSAKGIGCSVVNIGSGDIIEVREHLILGLIWQIIRRGLLGKIDIKLHPELYRLLDEDETLEQFLRLPPEQILLRWFNYHLKNAKWDRRVTNFSSDVKDGENYTVLLNQLAPELCSRGPLQTRDLLQRAEQVLQNSEKLDCRKFLTPTSLVAGNPKLNLAFVANLFNTHPGLEALNEEEKLNIDDFDAEGEREARVFTLWLNSLDVQPTVNSLYDDLRDGTVLMQAYDKVIPGSVNFRHVNKPPAHGGEMSRFKAVENTNYAIELGKQNRFSLVGVQGADITDGQKTLTLGLVWQLMRRDIVNTLGALAQRMGKRDLTDSDMVKWANDMSRKGGKTSQIRSFKDPAIGTGVFLLDVLNGMKSSYVDYDLVTPGKTPDDAYANAKLSISIARKMGATIWLVPEDIQNCLSRLVTTFVGMCLLDIISIMDSLTLYQARSWRLPRRCELVEGADTPVMDCQDIDTRPNPITAKSRSQFCFCSVRSIIRCSMS